MSEVEKYKKLIANIEKLESNVEAIDIIDAYHKLHELKNDDLDNFLFEYTRRGIDNEYLNHAFESHLISCDYCLGRLTRFKTMFDIIDEYGEKAKMIVLTKELIEQANGLVKKNKLSEAINSLDQAQLLSPQDHKIGMRISTLKKRLPLKLLMGSVEKTIGIIEKRLIIPINTYGKIMIKRGDEILLDFLIKKEPIVGYRDENVEIIKFEDSSIAIHLRRGIYEDILIIEPKVEKNVRE